MRTIFLVAVVIGIWAGGAQAQWIDFVGGPNVAVGTWPVGTSALSGTATVTASNFVNGNLATPGIGLTPNQIGPPLSTDFFAAGLLPNADGSVPVISTPYNDAGDSYHVVIDFSGTIGGPVPGVLPAGTLISIVDLDIQEDFRNITATNALSALINTPWLGGPNAYFDSTPPMVPQSSLVPNPTLTGPVAGVYQMFGVDYNFDVGMWLFETTQDVRTISFDMSKSTGGNAIGGGGAGWAFYSPVPEPSSVGAVMLGAVALAARRRRNATARG